MKQTAAIFLLLLFTTCFLISKESFAQPTGETISNTEFSEAVDSVVMNKMHQYTIPGIAIGLVKDDSIIYTKGYGVSEIGANNQVSENSVFHTASISKLFTALAIMQLVEKGLMAIDSKLVDILPELHYRNKSAREITVKQLLNHTSGLPDIKNYHWKNNHQSKNSLQTYVSGITLKASFRPSSEYHYSNLGYDILGYLVEKVSGVTFEDYVLEHILSPSGMKHSDFRYFNIPDSLRVSPHSRRRISQKVYARKTYPYTREHSPSSTLNASAKDLSKWMTYFLKELNDGNSTSTYRTMLAPSSDVYPHIGLGFQLYDFENNRAVGHYGGDQGFRSFLMMIPDKNIGLVVLGNCDYQEDYRQEIIGPIAKLMLAKNIVSF